ncbi:MAG: hypothetical protein GY856_25940 [bacterium]|nr:hypothetical protein [bacterium]
MYYDPLDYHQLVQEALRGIVRRILEIVAEQGLPGGHHFYITFRTQAPGVVLPPQLAARYPEEMTIVVQHQFRDLLIGDDEFSIGLSFAGVWEELTVSFSALSAFVDPTAEFGLRFTPLQEAPEPGAEEDAATATRSAAAGGEGPLAEVVSLDAFRKR